MSRDVPIEDIFAGRLELTASELAYLRHAVAELYIHGGWCPKGENRRDFVQRLNEKLGAFKLDRMVTPDGSRLVSVEEHAAIIAGLHRDPRVALAEDLARGVMHGWPWFIDEGWIVFEVPGQREILLSEMQALAAQPHVASIAVVFRATPRAGVYVRLQHKVGDRVIIDTGWEHVVQREGVISKVCANHGRQGAHRYYGRGDGGEHGFYEDQILVEGRAHFPRVDWEAPL